MEKRDVEETYRAHNLATGITLQLALETFEWDIVN